MLDVGTNDQAPEPFRKVDALAVPVALMLPTGTYDHDAFVPSVVTNLPAFPVCPGRADEKAVATTNAVVAICVVAVPADAVGAVGTPVNAGEARGAKDVATKPVVAICVVLVPGDAVGAVGVPVNAGLALSARTLPVPVVVNDDPHADPVLYGIPTGG